MGLTVCVLSGVLMMSAWMWIVSAAVLIARHFKLLYPDSTLLGQRYWFQVTQTRSNDATINALIVLFEIVSWANFLCFEVAVSFGYSPFRGNFVI